MTIEKIDKKLYNTKLILQSKTKPGLLFLFVTLKHQKTKYVYKIKYELINKILCFKAQYVVKKFFETQNIDYNKIFTLVI